MRLFLVAWALSRRPRTWCCRPWPGCTAAALLIAAKRADAIASETALHTLKNTEADTRLLRENSELTRQVKEHTDLLEELHAHVTALSEHLDLTVGHSPPRMPESGD